MAFLTSHAYSTALKQKTVIEVSTAIITSDQKRKVNIGSFGVITVTERTSSFHLKHCGDRGASAPFSLNKRYITHSVNEVLLLGERLFVMVPRPGRVHKEYNPPFSERGSKEHLHEIKKIPNFQKFAKKF